MHPPLGRLADGGHDRCRLQPIQGGLEAVVVAQRHAAADEVQNFIGGGRHQARGAQADIARFDDLRRGPDKDVRVPNRSHAMLGNGFDADLHRAGLEVDRRQALRLGEREERVGHEVRWAIVEQAKRSVLFETPIAHFLVRAFLAEGVDEFLAHITTIEAALGLRADYQKSFRIAPDRHKGMRATNRMRGRVAGLLGGRSHADQYEQLFDIRSAFLHGRAMTDISTQEQVMARSLARQVVEALILATRAGPVPSREDFLDGLLDAGAPLI